jgi:hypothetical protein
VNREVTSKAEHDTFVAHEPSKLGPGEKHGYDSGAEDS